MKKKRGVELFLQAQKIEWEEAMVPGGMGWSKSIPCSDEFLGACQKLAVEAFNMGAYEDAMRYCKYVRDSYYMMDKDMVGNEMLGTSMIQHLITEHMKKRPGNFNPEMVCTEVEIALCSVKDSPFYNLQEALHNRKRAAALCSINSIEMLAEHYYEAATCLEEAKEAYFYYDLIDGKNNSEFIAKKKAAWNKYVSMMAGNVTNTLMSPAAWMPVADANMTWECYSGLTEEVSERLPRKSLDDRIVLSGNDIAGTTIKSIGDYQPGVIDLDALWQQFVNSPRNQKVDKQVLFLKKMKYNECLYIGDFADCCKYLWEQTYKNN